MMDRVNHIFDTVYIGESERLSGFVYKRINNLHDAEDIVQEVWLRLHSALKNTTINNPNGWIYRVARNLIIDYHRQKSKLMLSIDEDGKNKGVIKQNLQTFQQYKDGSDEIIWAAIEQAMAQLSDKHRIAFEEIDVNGKSYKELAEESNVTVGTWLSRNYYAKQKLKKYLQYFYEEFILNM
jgi:RNA polymerase sigma factor (sigma-70 family)